MFYALSKLLHSSTAWASVIIPLVQAAANHYGAGIPWEVSLASVFGYAVKEGADKLAARR